MIVVFIVDIVEEISIVVPIKERFIVETLATILINFESDGI